MIVYTISLILVIILIFSFANSFQIILEPNTEECIFEYFNKSDKVEFSYEVINGGFLDAGSKVLSPSSVELYRIEKQSHGLYDFVIQQPGIYYFCLNNKEGSQVEKTVQFHLFSEPHYRWERNSSSNEKSSDFEESVKDLIFLFQSVKSESEYSFFREIMHDYENTVANRYFMIWGFFEMVLMILVSLGQVVYLKHLFEVRRIV